LIRSLQSGFYSRIFRAGCLCLLLAAAGCGSSAELSIAAQSGQRYRERFTQAYVSHDAAGNEMVVLARDPMDDATAGSPGQPLAESRGALLRQIVQVQLLYRPMSGARGDSPAATNAAVHWYIYPIDPAARPSMLQYIGTAFASVNLSGNKADVIIRRGQAIASEQYGELVDPLHAFTIEGRFDALVDDAKVAQILDEVHQAARAAAGVPGQP
jgi:hypothetical protein